MDETVIKALGLGLEANPIAQAQALQYFEQLKASDTGWQMCINVLTSGAETGDHVKFYCMQVIEHYVKTRYTQADMRQQEYIKGFLSRWIQLQCVRQEKSFLRNKVAQIFTLVFLVDYPLRWPTFFNDLLQTLNAGAPAVDMYVRILKSIDSEIVDREVVHSHVETERNTRIKDTMREQCVQELVDSWFLILSSYDTSNPELTCQCLDVVGAFVMWIDINLIANDRFVTVLVRFLSRPLLQEATCDCIYEIINKGMDPVAKTKLVESFVSVLESAGVFNINKEDDSDFIVKLARLVNGIGTALILCYAKVLAPSSERQNGLSKSPDQKEAVAVTRQAIEAKVPLLLRFLSHEYDDVSQGVSDFAREYIQLLKQSPTLTKEQIANVEATLYIVIKKFKYDDSYSFDHEGEEEGMFQEYRKQLKIVFDNLAQLERDLVMSRVRDYVLNVLRNWQTQTFQEVETAVSFLYLLGEAIPVSQGNHFTGDGTKTAAMLEMMQTLVTCGVSCHPHFAVTLQYFETVTRYEKFFTQEPQHIPEVLVTFLDRRGLRHSNAKVRSRIAYLYTRFIKCQKAQIQPFVEDMLKQLEDLLVLYPQDNGVNHSLLSADDQLFLYETASVLVVSGHFPPRRKQFLLKRLLSPVIDKFDTVLQRLMLEQDETQRFVLAECLSQSMQAASRTSKAFSNQQTIKSCGCIEVYLDCLQTFLRALECPHELSVLQGGVRQFLHRMVVCLEEELLPYVPTAAGYLLKNSDIRSVQEFIPLINQIIAKFKKEIVPFLQQVFMPLVKSIFNALAVPFDDNDQQAARDKQLLQRSYFLFVSAIVANNVTEVIAVQEMESMRQVLLTIIQGAVEFPDPVAQKTCFNILRKLVELWGGPEGPPQFRDFMYESIVPACFMAPMKNTFDLNDAQTIQALSESALCLRTVLDKRGQEVVVYLQTQYLPKLDLSPEVTQEFCQALQSDPKIFKNYLKVFFQRSRT